MVVFLFLLILAMLFIGLRFYFILKHRKVLREYNKDAKLMELTSVKFSTVPKDSKEYVSLVFKLNLLLYILNGLFVLCGIVFLTCVYTFPE